MTSRGIAPFGYAICISTTLRWLPTSRLPRLRDLHLSNRVRVKASAHKMACDPEGVRDYYFAPCPVNTTRTVRITTNISSQSEKFLT